MLKKFLLIIILFISGSYTLLAQFNEYNPDYEWVTIVGENVTVHYHPEAERTARTVLKIIDEVWGPITSLYNYEPDRVHFVIKDIDDYSNGAAFFFDNKIEIWASSLDFDLRGTHNWLRNVISHEFTHIVQLQAGMKWGRSLPAFYFQYLNYQDKRRPDILYGYPNFILSYPIPGINVPAWFAEGTAQYMRKEFNYDNWDSHRDMILRSYALDGNMISWNEMGVFGKTSLGNESVYNAGFALTRYISQKYGEDKLREITENLGRTTTFTIDDAFKRALGKDGIEVYDEWRDFLTRDYNERTADIKSNLVAGENIIKEGFGNFHPVFSNDGKKMAYISNKGQDYFSMSAIFEYDIETKKEKMLAPRVRSSICYSPDGKKIYYAKLSDDNPRGTNINDIYVYDIENDEETRITYGMRANNPTLSSDGKKIAFVFQKDGTINLGVVDVDGKNFQKLTNYNGGEQLYNPQFSKDDSKIIFDYSYHHGRDLAVINSDGSGLKFILNSGKDERNAVFLNDNEIIYSSNETGIFNLYKYDLNTQVSQRISNVLGGTFYPAVDESGNIAYAGYTSTGYKIFYLNKDEQSKVDETKKYVQRNDPPLDENKPKGDISQFDIEGLRNFNDEILPENESKRYSGFFSNINFFPLIRIDNYNLSNDFIDNIKPGIVVASSDFLNRYDFIASAALNKRMERDLYLIFNYRNTLPFLYDIGLKPELSFELYSISRKSDADVFFGVDSTYDPPKYDYQLQTGVSYNLLEADFVAKHKLIDRSTELELRFILSNYTTVIESFIYPDGSGTLFPTTDDTYFEGKDLRVKLSHESTYPTQDADINPVGRKLELQYDYEFNDFNIDSEYEIEDGILKPAFKDFNFHRLEFNYEERLQLFRTHTLTTRFRVASILGPDVPDFFDSYLGGLIGMKGYPFYAISGNELGWVNFTYRFPLFRNIDRRFGHLYIDKVFLSIHGDYGYAWTGAWPGFDEFKKGAGMELRIKLNSFYLFPTSIFLNASYAFDKYNRTVNNEDISYGKELLFYGGVLFDFSF
ncbi:MAG: biopolymer transporter Tol [Ignavibacteria bacterium]|jgi:Tol biopolymer transport system component